ncbi:MAG TPA: metallophosphoesterase [Fimbriimonadaceae bacterium]|jgi:3',5'-cyclic AMP phosphodiesterase CpdA
MIFLAAALLAQTPFVAINHKPLPPSKDDFYFVALGDNRPAGAGLPPTGTYREILKEVAIIDPEFVLSTGDLLYGNDDTLDQYKQEEVWMKPLLDTLPCPFFNVPGNHEVNNNPAFLDEYTKTMGPAFGRFDFGQFRFLAVCTELPAEKPTVFGAQMDWLKTEMANPKPTFIYEHHPVYNRVTNTEDTATVSNGKELHQLYLSGGVKAVFEGHDHVYDAQTHDGIMYTIAGGSGAPLDATVTDGGFFNYVIVHVSGTKIDESVITPHSLEVVPITDGVAAIANYAFYDIPVRNMIVFSKTEPKSVTAGYGTKTGKTKSVDVSLVDVARVRGGFEAQVALMVPHKHATFVKLGY